MYKNINSCLQPVIDFCTLSLYALCYATYTVQIYMIKSKIVKYHIAHPHS